MGERTTENMSLIFVLLTLLYFTPTSCFTFHKENNACPRLLEYPVKAFSPHCYVNPNVLSSTPEMIKQNGYKCGTYKVVSEDGYTSLIFRVLPQEDDGREKGQPIVLDHGVQVNSAAWTWMGNRSLAFVLARAGYDVWLANQRDSGYTTHIKYKTSDYRFWTTTLDDVASYEVPAILKTIASETNKSGSIIYIGHSRGTVLGFMYASEYPDEAQKYLRGVVALAPAVYLEFSFFFKIAFYVAAIILRKIPIYRTGRFQKYDYGKKQNMLKYGQAEPPLYHLSNVKLPVYLFYGKRDVYMKKKTVKRTFEEIGSNEKEYFSVPIGNDDPKLQFGHNDFISSRYIEELLYKDLLKVLNKLKPKE
ncbi:lipase 3-like [Zophobas morio]|uniref:lipase 3-like n=1 Tax=Zophobas morio TaxID=2755281 RepID=UPI003083D53D